MAFDSSRLELLSGAFNEDGFQVVSSVTKFNGFGLMAEHKSACNYDTGLKKKAYYLEGTPYELGYLLGILAEKEIASMTEDFLNKVFFRFIGSKLLERIHFIRDSLIHLVSGLSKRAFNSLPNDIQDEIKGLNDGCKEKNADTKVSLDRLITLNLGCDILLSLIYTGDFLLSGIPNLKPSEVEIPIMCNAFSVFGKSAGNGHYFGRDFMFPTADVFHNTAAMIIYNPVSIKNEKLLPYISVTSPGLVGSISAMNIKGIGIGVDMSPAANCDPFNIGINSLLLARHCIQYGESAEQIIEIMQKVQRGVSWNYVVSDGTHDKACVIECGKSDLIPDPLKYTSPYFRPALPDLKYIKKYWSSIYKNGLMIRWSDYKFPSEYLKFNKLLWQFYNRLNSSLKAINSDAFSSSGYINPSYKDKNCPSQYYFAPQREELDDLIIATNHYIIPEMRLYGMHPWIASIVKKIINDIQWRYDALNDEILRTLKEKGAIDYKSAKELIDYLAPYGKYPDYYAENPRSRDGKEIVIQGCTSILDLKSRTIESHYGYYCDEWVKLTLPFYL